MILHVLVGISVALIAIGLSRNEKPALSHLDTLTWTGFAAGVAGTTCGLLVEAPADVAPVIGVSVAGAGALALLVAIRAGG